jgi:hypothetical protein
MGKSTKQFTFVRFFFPKTKIPPIHFELLYAITLTALYSIKFEISEMLDGQRQQYTPHNTVTYILCGEMVLVLCGFGWRCTFHKWINGADRERHVYIIYRWTFLQSRTQPHPIIMT